MSGWTEEGLIRSWRALAEQQADEDWRLVSLTTIGLVSVQAGRHFPDSREALIVAFPSGWLGKSTGLPDGRGFEAAMIEGHAAFMGKDVIALIRRVEGAFDIFAIMAVDLLRFLDDRKTQDGRALVAAFLQRVREWQAFMSRGSRPLSQEAQAGLYGELATLRLLTEVMPGSLSFDSWKGPMHSAQDFHLGSGALEVKTTSTSDAFKARINSIEQLDSERQPMFVGAVRLADEPGGTSLSALVALMRDLAESRGRRRAFDALLVLGGYYDEHASLYARPLSVCEFKCYAVDKDFPALRRAALPAQVTAATYTLDLSSVPQPDVGLPGALSALGITQ
ncbi:PD-(D/E)XK motif protein [uncultured Sphingomonas sp.]|uniref:PD-(D/E)XK motif protein n=1 Tax=uncultured Sphingomonas sp. TaxID=158754 RepID=UPI0037481A51